MKTSDTRYLQVAQESKWQQPLLSSPAQVGLQLDSGASHPCFGKQKHLEMMSAGSRGGRRPVVPQTDGRTWMDRSASRSPAGGRLRLRGFFYLQECVSLGNPSGFSPSDVCEFVGWVVCRWTSQSWNNSPVTKQATPRHVATHSFAIHHQLGSKNSPSLWSRNQSYVVFIINCVKFLECEGCWDQRVCRH